MAKRIIYIKRGDTTYVAEDRAYRDKEKGPRHERFYIGKLGPDGKIIYNKGYKRRVEMEELRKERDEARQALSAKDAEASEVEVPVEKENGMALMGERIIIREALAGTGLDAKLSRAFGKKRAAKLMALASYSVCTGGSLSNCLHWLQQRGYGQAAMTSTDVSELLASIEDEEIASFLRQWAEHNLRPDVNVLFDITSISTYAHGNPFVAKGYNRDRESLPQVNMSLLSSVDTGFPVWYQVLSGNINDSVVLDEVLDTVQALGAGRLVFVGDRGFFSAYNLQLLHSRGHGFLIPVPSSVGWQNELIDKWKDSILDASRAIFNDSTDGVIFYADDIHTFPFGEVRCHIYYDPDRKETMMKNVMSKANLCRRHLNNGTEPPAAVGKYLDSKLIIKVDREDGSSSYEFNPEEVMRWHNGRSCYWILLDTENRSAEQALRGYRERDDVEDFFDDCKNTLDMNRLRNHDLQHVMGKVFVQFLSMIVLHAVRKYVERVPEPIREYRSWSDILQSVCTFHETRYEGVSSPVQGTATKTQRGLFDIYGIEYTFKGQVHNKGNKPDKPLEDWVKEYEARKEKRKRKKKEKEPKGGNKKGKES